MRIYFSADEERVHLQQTVRDWTSAGLLESAQGEALQALLRTDLRRTNVMLRAVLAFFAAIITAATVGLAFVTLNVRSDSASAVLLGLSAIACFLSAEAAVSRLRLYRFGIEEALAGGAVLLAALTVGTTTSIAGLHAPRTVYVGSAVAATGALWVYERYGLVYALVAAIAIAASIPFQSSLAVPVQRSLSALILLVGFAAARALARRHVGTFREQDFEWGQAAAWIGVYLVMNVQLSDPILIAVRATAERGAFYWLTFAVVWLMPAAGLSLALRERNRPLMDASIVLTLVTLATNKSYLGLRHNSWDPILLGVLLAGVAVGVRRWLAAGENGERAGFTPSRIVDADRALLQTVANVSAGFHQHAAPPPPQPPPPGFGGGRSGGGGTSGSW